MVNGVIPKTLPEALALLAQNAYTPYAGGTELMVKEHTEANFLFLHELAELQGAKKIKTGVRLGAACTFTQLLESPAVPTLLKQAVEQIAAPGIRNLGTLGGNVCNASPAGDTLPVLYLCNAKVELASLDANGTLCTRWLPLPDFILGVRKTALAKSELLVAIEMEDTIFTHTAYEKVGARKAQAIAKLSFVGGAKAENGRLTDFRVAFGAVGPTVVRRPALEAQILREGAAPAKANLYSPELTPIDDQRSSAEYRKQVCLNLLANFLEEFTS